MDGSNASWIEREHVSLASAMQRVNDPAYGPVIFRGKGTRLWDAEGRLFFDLTCGYSACNFGHAFAPLVQAAERQLQQLTHLTGMSHRGRIELAEQLLQYVGNSHRDRVLFNTNGSRAVESAWKAAYSFRPGKLISIGGSYHGRSALTSWLSDTPRVDLPLDLRAAVHRRSLDEYAYCSACSRRLTFPDCELACQKPLIDYIDQNADEISAVIVEPALGARGYIAPPDNYFLQLRKCTREHGILLIADEIQMGLGRSGHWLLSQAQGWVPDLVVLGKSLGGGIAPISAVVGSSDILNAIPPGSESETFAASPLATAVGLAVLEQLAHGPWMHRALHHGTALRDAIILSRWFDDIQSAERGMSIRIETLGASASLEFFDANQELAKCASQARTFAQCCVSEGLLVHYSGPYATRVVLLPPLTIDDEEMSEVKNRLTAAGDRFASLILTI